MASYQLTSGTAIVRSDGAIIPNDPENVDYHAYLSWVAAGNTPAPISIPTKPTTISSWDFLNRFTPSEQIAVQTACNASVSLQVGLTQALADGVVDLMSPVVAAWMGGMVAAGAITSARSAVLTTP